MPKYLKAIVLAVIYVNLLLVSGCDQSKPNDIDVVNSETPLEINLVYSSQIDKATLQAIQTLKIRLESLSNETVTLNLEPVMFDETGQSSTIANHIKSGDLAIINTKILSQIEPSFEILNTPFLFKQSKTLDAVVGGVLGNKLLTNLNKHQLMGFAFWQSGFNDLISNQPLVSKDQINGMILNNQDSALAADIWRHWGARIDNHSISQKASTDEDGAFEAKELNRSYMCNLEAPEDKVFINLTGHQYLTNVVFASLDKFNALPANLQQWLVTAVAEVSMQQFDIAEMHSKKCLDKAVKKGFKLVEVDENLLEEMRLSRKPFLEKYRFKIGTDIVEQTLQDITEIEGPPINHWVVGLDADLTSNSAKSGLAIKRGIELAIQELNQQGGLLGKPLYLVSRDNAMVPAKGLKNIEYFSQLDNTIAVFGGISSPVVLSELESIHKNNLLFLNPWAAATNIVDNGYQPNMVFRVSVRDEYAAPYLLRQALKRNADIGLLLVNNPWGRSNFQALETSFHQANLPSPPTEWFNWGESNFENKITNLQEAGVKSIIFVGNSVEGAKMVKALAARNSDTVVYSHWGITGGNFTELAGNSLDRIKLYVLQTFSFFNKKDEYTGKFIDRYHKQYMTTTIDDIVAPVGTAHAYDLMQLLALAVKQTQSTKSLDLVKGLEKVEHHKGLVIEYRNPFSQQNHDALDSNNFILAQYKNGILVPVL